jgi:Domain of unknown function (DUF4262)
MSLLNVPQTDPHDQRFIDMIREYGHAVQYVASAEDDEWEPPFAYSVGGAESYGAPELIISGLGIDVSKSLINHFMDQWKSGYRFSQMIEYGDFLEGFPVIFMATSYSTKKKFACYSDWYYEREDFELWQVVWPGAGHGMFPWQVDDQLADVQVCFVDGGWPRIH